MNRRGFILQSALGIFGFTILPGAGRVWKAIHAIAPPPAAVIPLGDYVWDDRTLTGAWNFVTPVYKWDLEVCADEDHLFYHRS